MINSDNIADTLTTTRRFLHSSQKSKCKIYVNNKCINRRKLSCFGRFYEKLIVKTILELLYKVTIFTSTASSNTSPSINLVFVPSSNLKFKDDEWKLESMNSISEIKYVTNQL